MQTCYGLRRRTYGLPNHRPRQVTGDYNGALYQLLNCLVRSRAPISDSQIRLPTSPLVRPRRRDEAVIEPKLVREESFARPDSGVQPVLHGFQLGKILLSREGDMSDYVGVGLDQQVAAMRSLNQVAVRSLLRYDNDGVVHSVHHQGRAAQLASRGTITSSAFTGLASRGDLRVRIHPRKQRLRVHAQTG